MITLVQLIVALLVALSQGHTVGVYPVDHGVMISTNTHGVGSCWDITTEGVHRDYSC